MLTTLVGTGILGTGIRIIAGVLVDRLITIVIQPIAGFGHWFLGVTFRHTRIGTGTYPVTGPVLIAQAATGGQS